MRCPLSRATALACASIAISGTDGERSSFIGVHIQATLGDVEIELPKVMDLCRGDVLRLAVRLDQPLTLACEGKPFAHAALGEAAGRKAVQITGSIDSDKARMS